MTERKKFLDPDHPMFARAWVRWLTAILPLGWGAVEFWNESPFWGMLFLGAGGFAFWQLIVIGPGKSGD
jgi:hypothetical protein